MKKLKNVFYFIIPLIISIAFSMLAFLLWNMFNYGMAPIISTSIILCIVGSFLCGFLSCKSAGKKGMYLAIASIVIAVILWIIAYQFDVSELAYPATALSSYYFNIQSCLPYTTPEWALYLGYVIALVVPVGFIALGRFLRVKIFRGKA